MCDFYANYYSKTKIRTSKMFGGDFVKIKLVGDTFDASKRIDFIQEKWMHLFIL